VRYKSLYYVVFISFLILKIVVSWVESVKIPASKMAAIKQSPVPPPPPLSFCEGPRILQNLRDVVFQIVELPLYILSFLTQNRGGLNVLFNRMVRIQQGYTSTEDKLSGQ